MWPTAGPRLSAPRHLRIAVLLAVAAVAIQGLLGALPIPVGRHTAFADPLAPAAIGVGGGPATFFVHSSAASTAAVCYTIESNQTLSNTYDGIYQGLPKQSSSGGAGNNTTGETPQSAYPNESAGSAQLISAWAGICGSAVYQGIYASQGPAASTSGYELNGSTGDYQVDFGFNWVANCTDPATGRQVLCQNNTLWWVDLRTGSTEGPFSQLTLNGTPLGTGGLGSHRGPPAPWYSGDVLLWISVAVVAAAVAFLALVVGRGRRPPRGSKSASAQGGAARATGPRPAQRVGPNPPGLSKLRAGGDQAAPSELLDDVY